MFFCSRCGKCCRQLGRVPELSAYDRGDGVCRHLEGDLCEIYENRPPICNVDKSYDSSFKEIMTRDEFYELNGHFCRKIKDGLS
jgi:Fe-S-cluster containining protein